jgi:pimeloyl-ACP methyl ester carboxylesterase
MTYVLIPGAGGDAWYWHLVERELAARGHDAISVELPSDDESAGLGEYTDAVIEAIGERSEVVLVAQSMGAFVAPLVHQRRPASSIVLVNAMIPLPGETPGAWWENTGQPQAKRDNDLREGRDPDAGFDLATYFFHDVPADLTEFGLGNGKQQAGRPSATRARSRSGLRPASSPPGTTGSSRSSSSSASLGTGSGSSPIWCRAGTWWR